MASEAPSWADQWGAGGIGAMDDGGTRSQNNTGKNNISGAKGISFTKVKAATMIGLQKIKSGASICVKWIRNQIKRRRTSK
ncbi:putative ankyrin repeat protein [Sesbania bispinosa]|nr:putative ankyrin repeat protein [Sesbania bispinosa]